MNSEHNRILKGKFLLRTQDNRCSKAGAKAVSKFPKAAYRERCRGVLPPTPNARERSFQVAEEGSGAVFFG